MLMIRYSTLVAIILTVSSTVLNAREAAAQRLEETRVKVDIRKGSLEALLSLLEAQSPFTFVYKLDGVKENRKFSLTLEGNLLQALTALCRQGGLLYEQNGSNIIINRTDEKEGRLSGRILDENGGPLPGASVRVLENGMGTQSGLDGSYSLSLRPGSYTLQVSYVSYQSKKVTEVTVTAGKTTSLVISLKPGGPGSLNEVVISSGYSKASVEGLYTRQKNNALISDGISADQIARSPDKNVGEILKRISGLSSMDNKYVVVRGMSERYNAAMLNGQIMPSTELNRKNFSYDIIPAGLIDNITVYKNITPDMSAEFGGGLVNVDTRAIPVQDFFNVTLGGSVNDQTTGKPFNSLKLGREYLGLPSSHRNLFGKLAYKNKAEIFAGNSLNEQGHFPVTDPAVFANNWGVYQKDAHPSGNLQLSWGKVIDLKKGRQLGFVASGSYRNTLLTQDVEMTRDGFISGATLSNPLDTLIYQGKQYGFTTNTGLMGGVGYTTPLHKLSLNSLFLNTLDQQLLLGKGLTADYDPNSYVPTVGYYDNTQWTKLWQTQLKGEHLFKSSGIKLAWMTTYINLDRQRPDNHIFHAQAPLDSEGQDPVTIIGPATAKGIDGAMRWWTRAYERDLNYELNASVPFEIKLGKDLSLKNTFKTGYAGWYKDRSFYVARSGSGNSNVDVPGSVQDLFDPSRPGFTMHFDNFSDDFRRNAALHGVYGMLDHKLGDKLRLTWGLRAEYYNANSVNGVLDMKIDELKKNANYDLSALYNWEKNWKYFPSAALTYSPTTKMNVRLSYAKSTIRPDLREMSYFKEYDFELGGEYVSFDPIVSTMLQNYDFRYEYYPNPGEILSFSLFYKKIDFPMEIYNNSTISAFILRNNQAAKNKGIELEFRKSLAFSGLPVLKNFTFFANGTRLFSKVRKKTIHTYVESPPGSNHIEPSVSIGDWEDRVQQGASNYIFNAGMYYDQGPVSVSLLYNYVSNRLFMANEDYRTSLYERPVKSLDGQLAFRLMKDKMLLRASVSNLLNSYSIVYKNFWEGQNENKNPGTSELLYQPGRDLIFYKNAPGRTYSFTIGYNF